jgi:hypothetical protein
MWGPRRSWQSQACQDTVLPQRSTSRRLPSKLVAGRGGPSFRSTDQCGKLTQVTQTSPDNDEGEARWRTSRVRILLRENVLVSKA